MLGPVFRLEMVTTARRFRYYAVRAGYTSILLFAVWMCYVNCFDNAPHWTIGRSARFSLSFFAAFSVIQLTAAILFTCAICAGTISQERQRRTIEYLFATDLTNSELVLGKLAGRLLNVLALLAASIPILFLTMFFGGVSANWVLQISAISVSTVLFSAAVSICLSIWSPRSRDAILRALVTLALLFFVVPYCIFLGQIVSPRLFLWLSPITTYLFHINPFLFISATFGSPIGMEATPGWEGVGAIVWRHCLASAALLAVAVWRVRRVHLDADVRPKKASKPQRLLRWRPGVGRFPMVWKELFGEQSVRDMGRWGRVVLALLLLVVAAPIFIVFANTWIGKYSPDDFHVFAAYFSATVGTGYLLVLTARSASSVTMERESQTWEVLLSTSLPAWQIVVGKTLGSIFAFRIVLSLVAFVWCLTAAFDLWRVVDGIWTMLALSILAFFFSGLGVLLSLTSKTSTRALCLSLLAATFLGGLYMIPLEFTTSSSEFSLVMLAPYLFFRTGSSSLADVRYFNSNIVPIGLTIYLALAVIVHAVAIAGFDRWAGRTHFGSHLASPVQGS